MLQEKKRLGKKREREREATSSKINKCVCVSTTDWVVITYDICKKQCLFFMSRSWRDLFLCAKNKKIWEGLTWFIATPVTGFISIFVCWLGVFDLSQEEVTWWWCVTSAGSPGEEDRTMTAVDFDDWSQAGILKRLVGNEIFKWSLERIRLVRLYRWV